MKTHDPFEAHRKMLASPNPKEQPLLAMSMALHKKTPEKEFPAALLTLFKQYQQHILEHTKIHNSAFKIIWLKLTRKPLERLLSEVAAALSILDQYGYQIEVAKLFEDTLRSCQTQSSQTMLISSMLRELLEYTPDGTWIFTALERYNQSGHLDLKKIYQRALLEGNQFSSKEPEQYDSFYRYLKSKTAQ